ncbi:coiled-coil domain-containing protein 141 isoform X1 [Ascaphus truei]|uniref:coiled-coil domain-containing protein 141 isoform X1 n=2 Tax=Ascaphus truei TaxID=8439 RepID=UPI003F5930E6
MSSERDCSGQLSTTTVSSVAIQAGESRIVVAILKSGELVELQLAEAIPHLLETGTSQDETKKLLQDHELLLGKLKSLEDHVWNLLCEADKTAAENQDQRLVYDAMAETLKEAWDALISVLEKRRTLLHLTSTFFETAVEFAVTMDEAEDSIHNTGDLDNVHSITELLLDNQNHTKVLLGRSLALLNKSQELTEFIELFRSNQPVANSEMIQGAHSSCLKIDGLLELLQDRRRQLDKHLKQQRHTLEQVLQVGQWHQQEEKVTCWLRKHIDLYLKNVLLGASLTENEELLHKHKQLVLNAKEWTSIVEKLKAEAVRILLLDCAEKETLKDSNHKLNMLHAEFWELMDQRQIILYEANDFLKSVNKAFDKLGSIETYLKHLKMKDLCSPVLLKKTSDVEAEIRSCTSDAFQKGQALVQKSSYSSGMTGIQEMIGYLQKRVDQLTSQCPVSTEPVLKKRQLVMSLEDHVTKVSMSIQKINMDLERYSDPGWGLIECEEVLDKLVELANQIKETEQDMGTAAHIIKEEKQTAPSDLEAFTSDARCLDEKLKTLSRSIDEKLEVLNVYITFLKSSKELKSHIQSLKKLYKSNPEEGPETDMTTALESADAQLQCVLNEFLSVQDMGQNCLNVIKMMNKNTILKDRHVQTVENTMDNLNKERTEVTNLWSTWQLRLNQVNATKQQWRTIKEQLRSATNGLQELEKDLQALSSLSLGTDFQNIINAQEKLNNIKTKFQQLHAEVEYAVRISELLHREGTPIKEKSEKVSELAQHHQRVNDSIEECEDIFTKIVAFYQVKQELESLVKSDPELLDSPGLDDDTNEAEIHRLKTHEQQTHVQNLFKLILNLGTEVISTIQHSNYITIPMKDLQKQVYMLERESIHWNSNMDEHEDKLYGNLHVGTTIEDVNELKESFKDLKKKINNLKFNYTKKSEKARNLKVIKNQIQQVEIYAEKFQILRKKIDTLEKKILTSILSQPVNKANVIQEAISNLQKQVHEFNTGVDEYKQNLFMAENLQHIIEECQFWCEEACATVVRVGRYSAECKTKETVEILLNQFNKFVQPTVPQQEERIQQMTSLAQRVYGLDDGIKNVEKTKAKHKEALHSVNELCTYLKELEDKLKVPDIPISDPAGEATLSQTTELLSSAKDGSIPTDTDLQPELLAEDGGSGDEYECISPDDISLPPLAETPESNHPQSETEQEEQNCYSSRSLHVSSYSLQMQINTSSKRVTDESELLTPVAYADTSNHKREKTSSSFERFYSPTIGYRVESPFAHHPTTLNETRHDQNTLSSKTQPSYSLMNEVHETHLQHHSVHESTKKNEQLHVSNNTTKSKDRLHATPDEFSDLMFQSDPAKSCQRHMVTQEAIKSVSETHGNISLAGQTPGFSKHRPNVTVKEGSPVTLEVEVIGYPEPTLTWYKQGHNLPTEDHLPEHEQETKHTLIIQEVCKEEASQYLALGTNSNGNISSSGDIQLKGNRSLISSVDWITLFVIYISVSIMYWLHT